MIRDAVASDGAALSEIYNYYIRHSDCTFETESLSPEQMTCRIQDSQDRGDPWLVLEDAGRIWGYAYACQFRARQAYRYTCEGSVYCRRDSLGRRLGQQLFQALIDRLRRDGRYYMLVGVISGTNQPSIQLCERLGLTFACVLPKVGRKNGKWLDTVYYYLQLQDHNTLSD